MDTVDIILLVLLVVLAGVLALMVARWMKKRYVEGGRGNRRGSRRGSVHEEGNHMGLAEPHATDVHKGLKTWEGRLNKGKHATFKKGDIITVNGKFKVRVLGVKKYDRFIDLIEEQGLDKVLPTEHEKGSTPQEAVDNVYRQFYPAEKEEQFGVLGINIEVV